jgi:hypothetical protein
MTAYNYSSGGFPENSVENDTLTMNGTSYTYDGTAWKVAGATSPEGTAILSTGEAATKYLCADGDNTSSWQILTDTVYSLTGTALDPTLGSIQTLALSAARTLTDSVAEGQSIILMITSAATHVITWPTITWVTSGGNVAPALTDSATVVVWKVGSTLYGAHVGSYV